MGAKSIVKAPHHFFEVDDALIVCFKVRYGVTNTFWVTSFGGSFMRTASREIELPILRGLALWYCDQDDVLCTLGEVYDDARDQLEALIRRSYIGDAARDIEL